MKADITLGVPGLGIITEVYDWGETSSMEALDKNIANGCLLLEIVLWSPELYYWGA